MGVADNAPGCVCFAHAQILGRVYYQNTLTEPVVVYGAVGVHLAASFVKRFIVEYTIWSRKQRGARKAKEVEGYVIPDADVEEMYAHHPAPASRWAYIVQNLPSAHAFSGALLLPAVAIHAWLNRIAPSSADAPIHELSPSELDYSYVTYGLSSGSGAPVAWRRITWALYGVLLAAGAVHVVGGADRIAKRMRVRKAADAARRRQRTAAAAAAAADGNGSASTATKSATDSASTSDMEPGASRAAMRATDLRRKRQRKTAVTAAISAAGVAWLSWGLARMASEKSGVSGFLAKRVRHIAPTLILQQRHPTTLLTLLISHPYLANFRYTLAMLAFGHTVCGGDEAQCYLSVLFMRRIIGAREEGCEEYSRDRGKGATEKGRSMAL